MSPTYRIVLLEAQALWSKLDFPTLDANFLNELNRVCVNSYTSTSGVPSSDVYNTGRAAGSLVYTHFVVYGSSNTSYPSAIRFRDQSLTDAGTQTIFDGWDGTILSTFIGLPKLTVIIRLINASDLSFYVGDLFPTLLTPAKPAHIAAPPPPPLQLSALSQQPFAAQLILRPHGTTLQNVIRDQVICQNVTDLLSCALYDRARSVEDVLPDQTSWNAVRNLRFNVSLDSNKVLSRLSTRSVVVTGGAVTGFFEAIPGRRWIFEVLPAGTGTFSVKANKKEMQDTMYPSVTPLDSNTLTYDHRDVGPAPKIVTNDKLIFSTLPVVFAIDIGTQILEGPGRVPDMFTVTAARGSPITSITSVYGETPSLLPPCFICLSSESIPFPPASWFYPVENANIYSHQPRICLSSTFTYSQTWTNRSFTSRSSPRAPRT